jgi:broad specificity phosphatase PhoE
LLLASAIIGSVASAATWRIWASMLLAAARGYACCEVLAVSNWMLRRDDSHLSARGVALARHVGAEMGQFEFVVTSKSPRTIETAVAMGYAVDDTIDMPSGYVPGEVEHHDQWRWQQPYVSYAALIRHGRGLASVANTHRDTWTGIIEALPDASGMLVVSHGGCIEPALVSCRPDADHASWGTPFGHCDGARLDFENGRFVGIRFRRAPLGSC